MAKKEISSAQEKVAAAEKKKNKKPSNPNGNWFVRAGKAIKKFFKDTKGEIKKIVWPDAKTVLKSTLVVLVAVAVCAAAIFVIDQLLSLGLAGLKNIAGRLSESTAEEVESTTTAAMVALSNLFVL